MRVSFADWHNIIFDALGGSYLNLLDAGVFKKKL